MAGFNSGRRAPTVSQFITNLNAIPSDHDAATQHDDNFSLEDDLAVFTNTEFFDFDIGDDIESSPITYDPAQEERARRGNAAAAHKKNVSSIDFSNTTYPYPMSSYLPTTSAPPTTQPYQTLTLSSPTTNPPPYPAAYQAAPETNPVPSVSPTSPTTDNPSARLAAEEDKRRRNTAASARFRVKKKQREQALERQAKELTDKNKTLEERVTKLETENEWLRGLVVERDGRDGLEEGLEMWRRKRREDKGRVKDDAKKREEKARVEDDPK